MQVVLIKTCSACCLQAVACNGQQPQGELERGKSALTLSPALLETQKQQLCRVSAARSCLCTGMGQGSLRLNLSDSLRFALKHDQIQERTDTPRLRQPKSTSGPKQPNSTTAADPNQDGGSDFLGMLKPLCGSQLCNQVIKVFSFALSSR